MAPDKFEIGDRVRVTLAAGVATTAARLGYIVERQATRQLNSGRVRYCYRVKLYDNEYYGIAERNLEACLYDGYRVTTWDACTWRPKDTLSP